MTDNIQHIDVDDEAYEGAPKALRDYVKKLQGQNKQLSTDLGQVRTQLNTQALSGVLADQGFKNPKRVEKALLEDGVDPLDKEAVDGWLSEYGDDYAKGDGANQSAPPVQNSEQAQAFEQLQLGDAAREAAAQSKWEQVQAQITPEMDGAAVLELYAKHGI